MDKLVVWRYLVECLTLEAAGGGEGPAAAALLLVLHRGHEPLRSPVSLGDQV